MLTLVHHSVFKFFDLTVIPLPACTKGRVQAFGFDPTFAGHRCDHSFNLINWQFEGDKIAQVRALLCINEEVRTIGGGDCNFVNSSEDAPSDTSGIILSGALRSAWTKVTTHFNFSEIYQPTPTHYFVPKDLTLEKIRTPRIGRVYMSLDLADRKTLQPVAFVPVLEHNILRRFTAASENNPFFVYYDD